MATQPPGTKLTIIAGTLRGRRCIHQADVFDKPISSPFPEHAFWVRLVAGLPTAKGLPQGSDLGRDRRFWAVMLSREVVTS